MLYDCRGMDGGGSGLCRGTACPLRGPGWPVRLQDPTRGRRGRGHPPIPQSLQYWDLLGASTLARPGVSTLQGVFLLERTFKISSYRSALSSMCGGHTQSPCRVRSCGLILFREGREEGSMVFMHEPVTSSHGRFKQKIIVHPRRCLGSIGRLASASLACCCTCGPEVNHARGSALPLSFLRAS